MSRRVALAWVYVALLASTKREDRDLCFSGDYEEVEILEDYYLPFIHITYHDIVMQDKHYLTIPGPGWVEKGWKTSPKFLDLNSVNTSSSTQCKSRNLQMVYLVSGGRLML